MAAAATYLPMADEDLAAAAELVAVVRVAEALPGPGGELPSTLYRVRVEEVVAGPATAGEVIVQVPGGVAEDGRAAWIPGSPLLAPGERALLFLVQRGGGRYGILHLALGAFHEVVHGGERWAVRDLEGARRLGSEGSADELPAPRRFDSFVRWLADLDRGRRRPPDYLAAAGDLPPEGGGGARRRGGAYTLLTATCGGETLGLRWFEFDEGGTVAWTADAAGQSGMEGGGFAELAAALAAWNDDPGSNVAYVGGGPGAGPNQVRFDDPQDEIPGSFDCALGGTLAIGGVGFFCTASRPFGTRRYWPVAEGFVVLQDGAGCALAGHGGRDGEEVFGHELGHTLALAHSTQADALMAGFAHLDGRGAALAADDVAALAELYPFGEPPLPPGPPSAPDQLSAVLDEPYRVLLTWRDRSSNETRFELEHAQRTPFFGFDFRWVLGPPPDTTSAILDLGSSYPWGLHQFRARACNDDGCSDYSNVAEVEVEAPPPPPLPPLPPVLLAPVVLSSWSVQLTWVDRSANEERFEVRFSVGDHADSYLALTTRPDVTTAVANRLVPATLYWFRVRACNAVGCSDSNRVPVTTPAPPPGPPPAAPADLQARATGPRQVRLDWLDLSDDESEFVVEGSAAGAAFAEIATAPADATGADLDSLAPATDYLFQVRARNAHGSSPPSNTAAVTTPPEPPPCDPGALCLLGGRFSVAVAWRNQYGGTEGAGHPVPASDESGYFWFFEPGTLELVVKVLDGQAVNGHFWVFFGALSSVEYEVVVVDRETGEERRYHNLPGTICGRGDAAAFPLPPEPEPAAARRLAAGGGVPVRVVAGDAGPCTPGEDTLCLAGGRFEVRLDWTNQHAGGETGHGRVAPLPVAGDTSGAFWFFEPGNVEVLAKVIDGRTVNGHFWFFYGGLSDIEYTLQVRDAESGATQVYRNPPGEICGGADTARF